MTGTVALAASAPTWAADPQPWQLNMTPGVTQTSQQVYDLHMLIFWICVVIGLVVFGAMGYAMWKFRKSNGAVADTSFTHSTRLEIVWTTIPILILLGMAWPATTTLIRMYDTTESELTVKVVGYQWLWRYEYHGKDVAFTSLLDRDSNYARKLGSTSNPWEVEHYLLNVDKPLVLPVDTKIRFVFTADDVIHSWWVPAFGWKQDAIPGFINEGWTNIKVPGTYRGQCAELCGKDHGFMPIVVEAVSREEFAAWVEHQQGLAAWEQGQPVSREMLSELARVRAERLAQVSE
ncbi:MAG TPA: cytochrome c oxidase subunit II [Xanthomonadaceae bacterium]|nr:cytochrome c oxidase subunit II [Xanthomonadaceae bacterium]